MVAPAKPVLEPDTPDWFKRFYLRALAFFVPVTPTTPIKLFPFDPTTRAASEYSQTIGYNITTNRPTFSDGTNWIDL